MPVLRKSRVIRRLAIETETATPAIDEIERSSLSLWPTVPSIDQHRNLCRGCALIFVRSLNMLKQHGVRNMSAGQASGTGAMTELEDEKVRKDDILSNRDKAQRLPGQSLDGKASR